MPLTETDWDAILDQITTSLRGSVRSSSAAVVDFGLDFPYVFGLEFMTDAILSEGLVVRGELWNNPPLGTVAMMQGFDAYRAGSIPGRDVPSTAFSAVPAGYVASIDDELGAWTLYGFLHRYGVGTDLAWDAALASVGDVFAVYEGEVDVVAVWRIRFGETEIDVAGVVAQALVLSARPTAWTTFAEGSDVVIMAAQDEATLQLWQGGPIEPLPIHVGPKQAPRRLRDILLHGACVKGDTLPPAN